jgi:hypothetical protein
MLIYGGTKEQILKQFKCDHDWRGSLIDKISRYYKCAICFALDRDDLEYQKHLERFPADNPSEVRH